MTDTGPPAAAAAETAALAAAAAVGEPTGTVALPAASTTFLAVPTAETHDMVYCCRKCRLPLFRPEQIGSHAASKHTFSHHRTVKEREKSRSTEHEQECTSFFLEEPVQWMKDAAADVEGKLNCPKCGSRVGVLKWTGNQCSCGTWVTPAIQMAKKSVDERWFPKAAPMPDDLRTQKGSAGSGGAGAAGL